MAALIVDDGKTYIATKVLSGNLYLGLMTNAEIGSDWPTDTDKQLGGDLTEVSGTGYARILLTGGSWSISDGVGTYAQQTFTVGAGGWSNVKGYFIAESLSGNDAIWAQSFPVPEQGNKNATDPIKVTPSYTAISRGE